MQNAIPHLGFYVIRVHDLTGSFPAVPGGHTEKQLQEFFRDPSQCWDHRSEKVSEHQTCQSSHVNGAIPLVGVNLFSLLVVAILPWSKLGRISFQVLCTGGVVVLGWRK